MLMAQMSSNKVENQEMAKCAMAEVRSPTMISTNQSATLPRELKILTLRTENNEHIRRRTPKQDTLAIIFATTELPMRLVKR